MPKIWIQKCVIPTYGVGEKNKNPMFFEKRVYQGSSGKVYPYPVVDKILDEKKPKEFSVVFMENDYIQIQIIPELGGRIYRALDKTNQYDFVYYNRVIKPALVGLTGPWISGGIEFNWPQHHRPNTFGPVEYRIDDTDPNLKTLWMGERDRMYGTKMTMGIILGEEATIKISTILYNPTDAPQTFLWWTNPAVKVHEQTRSIFPPDVYAVMDHGKRDVSRFPIAVGTYYKTDYTKGVDISRYVNIPVPTSYMVYHSDYDFVGGYDYKAEAGVLHVADHHISPGKKQWTWGNGEFGHAWDRNLTDEDGPYIELMAGVFTDNQPDFSWLEPYEEKYFTQYFMPYKQVGDVTCANKDIVLALHCVNGTADVRVYASRKLPGTRICLKGKQKIYFDVIFDLSPVSVFRKYVPVDEIEQDLSLDVYSEGITELHYTPPDSCNGDIPNPAKAIGAPETLVNNEALLLAGLHLEQYRHAFYEPNLYYKEGLKRDSQDLRINNAYGNWLLRQGQFEEAEEHFLKAKETATRHNPNPYDGEVFFNLGKAYEYSGKENAAFDAYYKAVWNDHWKTQGYLKLAQISCRRKNFDKGIEYGKEALYANYRNFKARNVLTIVYHHLGKRQEAEKIIQETLGFDPLNSVAIREKSLLSKDPRVREDLLAVLNNDPHNTLSLALSYGELGFYEDAVIIIRDYLSMTDLPYCMVYYYLAFFLEKQNNPEAHETWMQASTADSSYCFPNSLEDYLVLCEAIKINPKDAKAYYYLGCFLYDKKRYSDARNMWERSVELDSSFPVVHRNLALYYANKEDNYITAKKILELAFEQNKNDARVFYELCELYKKTGLPLKEQQKVMEQYFDLVESRDDLLVAYIEVMNGLGEYKKVIDVLMGHRFHPWEGGEGKIPTQHIEARIGIAKKLIKLRKNREAVEHLEAALTYYENFGEGKLADAQENNIYYYLGIAYAEFDKDQAILCLKKASAGLFEPTGAIYYNDQPPHMIFYQGLALRALGNEDEARSRFSKLVSYGEEHLYEKQTMDYFAVSLPDFLVFETNLDDKNRVHCHYMMGLGYLGLGDTKRAEKAFKSVLEISPNHYGALTHIKGE